MCSHACGHDTICAMLPMFVNLTTCTGQLVTRNTTCNISSYPLHGLHDLRSCELDRVIECVVNNIRYSHPLEKNGGIISHPHCSVFGCKLPKPATFLLFPVCGQCLLLGTSLVAWNDFATCMGIFVCHRGAMK